MPNQLDAEVVLRLKNLEKIINDVKKGFSQIKLPELNFSQRDGQNLITFIRALSQSGPQVRAASQNLDQFNAVLGNTARILNVATPGLKAYSNAQRAATQATTRQTQAQSRQVSVMEDLGRQTAITVRRFSGFLIARDLIFGLGFAFRSSITDAIKFEREISKIAQLQNTSLDSARQLGKFISNLAVQFGASATELAQSGQVLAQAGKSVGEIQTILKSLGQASLTPTFGDLTKTTDSLLAVLGQFELKAKDTAQVLDILNSVSKDFNVSVDELFEGVRRAGSTFSALSGVKEGVKPGIESLKEFVALFTSVIDTSRESAETIGTAFRTILPRLLRGNTRELLKKELGLDLLDDQKQFIGPFKAIEGLVKSINSLGLKGRDASLTKIAEELGGGRQFNRILPLLLEFPKAQRALDLANKSGGSIAQDTAIAYETLAVQIEQVKQRLQEIGRDLVSSGTFRAFADGFLIAAKSAATLVRALEPLIPLIATLATAKAFSSGAQFAKGFLFDNAFHLGPVKRAGGGNVNKVSSLLTPGELIIGPNSVRANGEAALRKFNATGDISSIRSLKGVSMVPGTGNTDSVHANLEPGSFVIKKSSVQKALGLKKYAQGGAVRLASGGPTFGLNPQLGGLDPATTSKLIRFGGELSILGESTKNINRLFKSILTSSRDLPTALQRISLEVDRALGRASAGTSGLRRNGILAGSTSTNKINIPQSQYSVALPFVPRRQQLVPAARDFTLNGGPRGPVYSQVTSAPQLALGRQPITDPRFLLPYYPTQKALPPPRASQTPFITPSPGQSAFEEQLRSGLGVSQYSQSSFIPPSRGFFQDASIAASSLGINSSPALRRLNRRILNPRRTLNAVGRLGISSARRNINSSNLAFGAVLAGSAITSNSNTSAGAGTGGALSGAGVGALFGSSIGPLGTAVGALTGALTGAVLAVKNFNRQLEEASTNRTVSQFLSGNARAKDISTRISQLAPNFQNDSSLTLLSTLRNLQPDQRGAFGRASFGTRLGARVSNVFGNRRAFDDVANAQSRSETNALQAQFEPAVQKLQSDLIDKLQITLKRGGTVDPNKFAQGLSQDELRVLAVGNNSFKASDLNDEEKIRQLGIGAALKFAKQTIEASEASLRLAETLSKLAIQSQSLTQIFNGVDAKFREFENTFSNFDNKIQAVLNPDQVSANSRFNVFSDIGGISTGRISNEISNIVNRFGIQGQAAQTTIQSANLASSIRNDLPSFLATQAAKNPTAELQDTIKLALGGQNLNASLSNFVNQNISSLFGGDKNTTLSQIDNFDQVASQLAQTLDPAIKIFDKIFSLQEESARKVASIVNSRTGLTSRIADQQLGINALGDRRIDIKNQLLSRAPASLGDIQRRVDRDVTSLTGGALSPAAILAEIQNIQKGGVGEDEATRFTNLTKALELLSNDTRILDATLEKNNQLQEAAQGARSIFERALSGPDEITKINQEIKDLAVIAQGGQVSGPRTLAALQTGRQLGAGLTSEQLQQQFGISKEQLQQNLDSILGNQGASKFRDQGFANLLQTNLRPSFALGNQATRAIDTQAEAASSLQQLDQQRVEQLNQLIQEQAGILGAAVRDAFNNEQVNQLTTALGSLKDAQLTLTGKTEVVVSFNNANGVFNGIQDELKTFIGGVVNEQIKQALQGPKIAGANTA